MAFNIKHVRPLFTGIVVTARKYVGEQKTGGGLIVDTSKMEGTLNPYQYVVSVGSMTKDIKEGDIVKINFKRYAKAQHLPGAIDDSTNIQSDKVGITYEIPMINLNGVEHLFIQSNDIEYVVDDFDGIDDGGLLQ